MDANGDFVITWTSFGQGNDLGGDSDVYAKRYARTDLAWNVDSIDADALSLALCGNPFVTTVDNPDSHLVAANEGYEGVVEVFIDDYGSQCTGSGTLLAGTDWVLTAAHCAWSISIGAPCGRGICSSHSTCRDRPGDGAGHASRCQPGLQRRPPSLGKRPRPDQAGLCAGRRQGFPIYTGTDEIGKIYTLDGLRQLWHRRHRRPSSTPTIRSERARTSLTPPATSRLHR